MAVLLHKWEFKNTEVEFLKVSEKILSSAGFALGFFFSFATIFANLIFFVPFSLTLARF